MKDIRTYFVMTFYFCSSLFFFFFKQKTAYGLASCFVGSEMCIRDSIMFDEYREPAYAPPPLLKRMVIAGRLGKKSGQGFYKY